MLHNSHNRCTLLCHHYSPTHLSTALPHSHESRARLQTSGDSNCLILIQSCRGFSEVKHCTGPYLWTLPAAFEPGSWKFRYCFFSKVITTTSFMNFSGIQRWRYHHHNLATTSTSPPAENPNIDISGGDSWIITVTAEHGAACTNSKMRPEDSLMAYAWWLEVLLHLFGLQKARTATNVCFHLLSLSDKSLSLAKHGTALRKNHWSCSVHQEYPRDAMQGKMKCCYAFGLPARGRKCAIAADFSGHAHFFRQESLLQLRWRTSGFSSQNFNATCSSMPGWGGSGLADLFARTSYSNKLAFSRTSHVT